MIAARVVVASDETALAALRKSKIYNVSQQKQNDNSMVFTFLEIVTANFAG